ncbi:MAG: hypothetical protein LBS49_14940 [Candidatus Accumulibacter sp.]|jgi:hypothetical protein|nr:hypothetical protein [Accumulibacter sp.]
MIVTLAHLRSVPGLKGQPGYCLPQTRQWCVEHDLSFRDFARHGLDSQTLLATGCPLARRLVEHAQEVDRHGR